MITNWEISCLYVSVEKEKPSPNLYLRLFYKTFNHIFCTSGSTSKPSRGYHLTEPSSGIDRFAMAKDFRNLDTNKN